MLLSAGPPLIHDSGEFRLLGRQADDLFLEALSISAKQIGRGRVFHRLRKAVEPLLILAPNSVALPVYTASDGWQPTLPPAFNRTSCVQRLPRHQLIFGSIHPTRRRRPSLLSRFRPHGVSMATCVSRATPARSVSVTAPSWSSRVLVTKDGYELLSMYPLEDALLDWKLCDPIHYPSVESVGSWELPPLDRPSRTLQGDKDTPSAGAAVPLAHAGTFMWWRT